MFYAISPLKDNIYYFPDEKMIAIATIEGSTLKLWDCFSPMEVNLDITIASLASDSVKEVIPGSRRLILLPGSQNP